MTRTTPGENNNHRPKAAIVEQNAYSWKRAAKLLGITVEDTQKLIAEGQLKLMDTFVTDRSFEDFCRKHGNEINLSLMDPATRRWLMGEYGISEAADGKLVPRAQKHALIIRECRCGRKIAGNVYFRHREALPSLNESNRPAVDAVFARRMRRAFMINRQRA